MWPFCVGATPSLIISYLGGTLGGISFNAQPVSNMPASVSILQIFGLTTRYRVAEGEIALSFPKKPDWG